MSLNCNCTVEEPKVPLLEILENVAKEEGGEASSSSSALAIPNNLTNANPKPKPTPKCFIHSKIPSSLLSNPALNAAISLLPSSYDFEIHKTLHRISTASAKRVALQLPDGLVMFSLPLADILCSLAPSNPSIFILADPTYGACCLADSAAASFSADFLVHYGNSCLVPVTSSLLPALYVFVDIWVDASRLAESIRNAFLDTSTPIALAGTIQFVSAVHTACEILMSNGYMIKFMCRKLSRSLLVKCSAVLHQLYPNQRMFRLWFLWQMGGFILRHS